MKKTTIRIISLSVLSLAASAAFANSDGGKGNDGKGPVARYGHPNPVDKFDDHRCHGNDRKCWSAPEIDPGQAMGALVLVSGAVAIVRGRRRKK